MTALPTLALLLALLPTAVLASGAERPPERFRHPFAGQVVVDDHWGGELTALGGPCYPWMGSHACAPVGAVQVCKINAVRGKATPDVVEHETAHCNGWPADHPK